MNIVLRKYQWEMRDKIQEAFTQFRKVLGVMPPGGGKTAIIASIAEQFAEKGQRIWILNNRSVVVHQLHKKVKTITNKPINRLIKEIKAGKPGIYIGTVQYVKNYYKNWYKPDLIIIDEAHHCGAKTYQEIIDYYCNSKILGLTATPYRGDGHHLIGDSFDVLINSVSMQELINKNFLCNYKIIAAPKLTSQQLQNYRDENEIINSKTKEDLLKLVQTYQKYCNNESCLVFAPTMESCQLIATAYQRQGILADFVNSKQNNTEEIIEAFKQKKILVLVNCEMLIDGIDIPIIKAIQIARPTKSLTLWIQMCGRALRTWKDKNIALILDHTDNHVFHGPPSLDYNWNHITDTNQKTTKSDKNIKISKLEDIYRQNLNKLESILADLDEEEYTDNYKMVKIKSENKQNMEKVEVVGENLVEKWERYNKEEIESKTIYKIYKAEGIKKVIQSIKERKISVDWKTIFNFLIYVKESKEYHPKWLVYTCFDINAPLEVWQQLAIYLNYKIGWAYHCYREMQESEANGGNNSQNQKNQSKPQKEVQKPKSNYTKKTTPNLNNNKRSEK